MNKKRTINMTEGGIVLPLILFILPMIGSSIFQQLYNTVDFLFVGNLLNKTSAAAVGASSTLITCCIGLFSGIAVGTSVVSGQAIGAGDDDRADQALHTSVCFGLAGGLLLMVLGILFAPGILRLLNTPETAMPEAIAYIRIYLLSLPMLIFYNMCAGELRALGDSQTPFYILVICGFVNVAADAFFMIVIPLGVVGVALATAVSQGLSALLVARALMKANLPVRLSVRKLRIEWNTLQQILKIGLPSGIQTVIITFSNVMVQYHINAFGETAVAAFATYYKVENFIYLPIMAFGQAATTFAAQNTGAGKFRRIRTGTLLNVLISGVVTFGIARLILCFPRTVFTWFMKDQDVVTSTMQLALVSFPFYWIYPIMEVIGGALRGMSYALSSMVIIVSNLCVLRVLLLVVFSRTIHTLPSLAAVYPITWAAASICFVIVFIHVMRRKLGKAL
ncbi:MAG: MATE family efflux transporter [Blautia sp.]|nr:MATE family efflux transporter [Blautia sp.]